MSSDSDIHVPFNQPPEIVLGDLGWLRASNTILLDWTGDCSGSSSECLPGLMCPSFNTFIRFTTEVLERERDPYGVMKKKNRNMYNWK